MRVNASLGFWYFLLFVVVWRQVLKSNHVQSAVHRILNGLLAPFAQWYAMYFVGIFTYMLYSLYELLSEYDSLSPSEIEDNLSRTYHLPQNKQALSGQSFGDFKEQLLIRPWLRYLNLVSQFVCFPVVAIAMVHVWKLLVLKSKQLAEQDPHWNSVPWKPTTRMNWLLLVVTMPVMFCVCSMRATCRILAIMTGKAHGHDTLQWPRVQTIEFAMYTSDLELAALFQFSTVYAFARICGSVLSDRAFFKGEAAGEDAQEYILTIKTAGFLGVWAFVAVGMVRCIFTFITAEVEQFESFEAMANKLQETALQSVSTVFSAITLLCVVNMFIICRMSIITDKLQKANQKFMGTRLLLLAGEIQAKIIAAFTVNSALYNHVEKHAQKLNFPIHKWNLTDEQSHLLHLSLLNFECLVVVIYNLVAWYQLDIEKAGILNFKPLAGPGNGNSGSDEKKKLLEEALDF
mmetsp:Transcript_50211/g.101027  ORF Transcript_50211/g.101027 Transcript_50211/m.101027 type:complete len:460 (-) Transcript_50211:357-1736(-)